MKYISASTISFTPAKSTFVPGLINEEVDLTCEVVESSQRNVKQVVSIVINKVNKGSGQYVASVTDYAPAKYADDQQNVEVYGDVSGTSGKKR